jgi:hypothetical protein
MHENSAVIVGIKWESYWKIREDCSFFMFWKETRGKQRYAEMNQNWSLCYLLFSFFSRHFIPFLMSRSENMFYYVFVWRASFFFLIPETLYLFCCNIAAHVREKRNSAKCTPGDVIWGMTFCRAHCWLPSCLHLIHCSSARSLSFTPLNMTAWIISSFSCFSSSRLVNSPTPLWLPALPLC